MEPSRVQKYSVGHDCFNFLVYFSPLRFVITKVVWEYGFGSNPLGAVIIAGLNK